MKNYKNLNVSELSNVYGAKNTGLACGANIIKGTAYGAVTGSVVGTGIGLGFALLTKPCLGK